MANISITNLPAAVSVSGTDSVPIVQTNTTVRTTLSQIAAYTSSVYPAGVTSIATASPITGGTITSTGTIGLSTGGVTNTYLGTMPTLTLKGNSTGATASPSDLSTSTVMTMLGAAPLASPTFTGTPLAPTPSTSNSSTQIATTAYVKAQGYGTGSVTSIGQTFTGGLIAVSGSPITTSGTLALTVAGTSGGVPYFSSTSTWASSAALAANAIVVGGGAGAAPATVTTGTGVVTALGVNLGTAGAFVVNGGALGTPSSGTLTYATGLPVGGISATGTPSSTTYLRGDGTWSTVSSSSGTVTSVGLEFSVGAANILSNSGTTSPITTSGTYTLSVAGTSGGIPYFSSTSAWASSATLTANGVVYGGGAGAAPASTAAGTTGQVLLATTSSAPSWGQVSLTAGVTGTLPIGNGGTGQTTKTAAFDALSPMTTAGDIILGGASGTGTRLAIGANTYVLTSNGTTAAWSPASGGGSGTVSSGTSGQLTYYGATGTTVSGNANLTVSSGALTIGVAGTTAGTLLLSGVTSGTTTLAVAAAASGTLTLPSATTTLAGLGIAQTFTATNTFNQINYANNAVTVTSNAGTVPITYRLNTFTNSSAATMAITMAVTSAVDGQMSIVRIYDFSAAAQTIGWTNTENSSVSVPTTSNGSTTLPLTVGFMYNSQTSKWRCVASA